MLDHSNVKQFYEQLYTTDYMGEDGFACWSQNGVELERVRDVLCQVQGPIASVLDYGCGQGRWATVLAEQFPAAQVTGIDISQTAIARAQQRFAMHRFVAFDGERAPFADGSFDLLFSYHVLEHVIDLEAVVADMARLVKKGGYLCIIFPCANAGSLEEKTMRLIKDGKVTTPQGEMVFHFERSAGHLRRLSSAQISERFACQGARLREQSFACQFFGAVDYLVRSTDGGYIRSFCAVGRAVHRLAALRLGVLQYALLVVARLIKWRRLGWLSSGCEALVTSLARLEWRLGRHRPNGSAQFLLFEKI
ncbi:class I SAM-dependent methyltransferase [Gloeobacter kilaueensis]|uniref:Ubiquinone/menaquinone biosynthesis methyltransferase n=1 Tax=Gloeobacter kilaueensis (strain ATCC BAA-2537 / CCAP 1431/1 / ULC 316 / JS1) TaxID=1183438 RepID=U5QCZ9_GLOK1|nr:class I SAM-dependent methyltransferase [Gloeobacter kilaueensis]AGY56723.1 ubiquinone/menaquinone biosynthesis methyltransferase [Gloeobacter kilaueensis JS1]